MKALDSCVINFACIKKAKQSLKIDIDDKFFAKFNFFDLKKPKLKAIVQIEKQERILNFFISTNGTVEVICDLSMENLEYQSHLTIILQLSLEKLLRTQMMN